MDYGKVPTAAQYMPLDFNQEQRYAIGSNVDAMPRIRQLVDSTNPLITQDALRRARALVPNYTSSSRQMGANTLSLLRGELPFDDASQIVSDRASLGGGIGTPGSFGPATLKDLGISRMDAMKSGSGMLGDMVDMAEKISPRASYLNPREMMVNPLDRLRMEMDQRQLEQQSWQNKFNLDATADPASAAKAQIRVGLNDANAQADSNAMAGYASAATQLINNRSMPWNKPSSSPNAAAAVTASTPARPETWQQNASGGYGNSARYSDYWA